MPRFVKIDVEGHEVEVLAGLSQPVPALSFECVPAVRDVALGCIDRLEALAGEGCYLYGVSLGERLRLLRPEGESADAIRHAFSVDQGVIVVEAGEDREKHAADQHVVEMRHHEVAVR